MKRTGELMNSYLANAIVAYDRARRRRETAEEAESDALQRVIAEAEDAGRGGPREVARLAGVAPATVTRHKAKRTLRPDWSTPGARYDEDEDVATRDAIWGDVPEERVDRGSWRVEPTEDGGQRFTRIMLGTARLNVEDGTLEVDTGTGEPLQGITPAEYADLCTHGPNTAERARVARRLARAILRTLHPTIQRTADVVDAATPHVLADVPGAYTIVTGTVDEVSDPERKEMLLAARSTGRYLGLTDQ